MKKIFFVILILANACTPNLDKGLTKKDYSFSNNMSFEEFKIRLNEYVQQSEFPNIDD